MLSCKLSTCVDWTIVLDSIDMRKTPINIPVCTNHSHHAAAAFQTQQLEVSTDLVDLLPHTRGNADQVVVAQTLEEGQTSNKLEGARPRRMPHHKLHTHMLMSASDTVYHPLVTAFTTTQPPTMSQTVTLVDLCRNHHIIPLKLSVNL